MAQAYSNESITSLKGADRVRKRPEVIFGSKNLDGCAHSIFEIIANSIDEAKDGHGNHIDIMYKTDGTVTVQDYGRGVPMDWNEKEQRFNWELVFCELYAGGKMDAGSYGQALGLNGLGCCATQYASEFMDVESVRDGFKYVMRFEKGNPVGQLQKIEDKASQTGTKITFKPDIEVFSEIVISAERLNDIARRQAMILRGLTISVDFEGFKTIKWYFEGGEKEFIEKVTEGKRFCDVYEHFGARRGQDRDDGPLYDVTVVAAFGFSRERPMLELYHNSSWLENGGASYSALRKASVKVLSRAIRDNANFQKGDEKITYRDVEDVLSCVLSTYCPGHVTSYENQTKKAVSNPFIEAAVASVLEEAFEKWLIEGGKTEKVLHEIVVNKQSRESADKIKATVIKKMAAPIEGLGNKPKKFVDCESKNPLQRELFVVEGDSALGSCKLARESSFQAIMPIRGKITNCMKEDIVKILKSEIIIDLIRVFGCGVEVTTKNMKELPRFDMTKLNWGKIIICTDADSDGMQIRCLLIALFYKMIPSLLKMGRIYIAETPLYEITNGKDTHFAYNEEEKDALMARLPGKSKIQRSKGLGENEPEMMSLTTMKPGSRRLIQVKYSDDIEEMKFVMEALLGDDIENRKMFIEQFSKTYQDAAE